MAVESSYGRESKGQGRLPKAFETPRGVSAEEEPGQPIKMLVEGWYGDNYLPRWWVVVEGVIPADCNRIRVNGKTLDLVCQWREDGNEEITGQTPEKVVEAELDLKDDSTMTPATIVAADKRVFHDLNLLHSGGINSHRLEQWLDTLHVYCGELNPVLNSRLLRGTLKFSPPPKTNPWLLG